MTKRKIFVYIDTSNFIRGNKEKTISILPIDIHFQRLVELASDRTVTLITNEIQQLELDNNIIIENLIEKAVAIFPKHEIDEYLVKVIEKYKKFLTNLFENAVFLPLDQSHEDIVDITKRSYLLLPPFSSKKKEEYKDAMIANAIANFTKINPDFNVHYIAIVKDNGFRSRLDEIDNVTTVDDIKDGLKIITDLTNSFTFIDNLENLIQENFDNIKLGILSFKYNDNYITTEFSHINFNDLTLVELEDNLNLHEFMFDKIIDISHHSSTCITLIFQINFSGKCNGSVNAISIADGIFDMEYYTNPFNDKTYETTIPVKGDFQARLQGSMEIKITFDNIFSEVDFKKLEIISMKKIIESPAVFNFETVSGDIKISFI